MDEKTANAQREWIDQALSSGKTPEQVKARMASQGGDYEAVMTATDFSTPMGTAKAAGQGIVKGLTGTLDALALPGKAAQSGLNAVMNMFGADPDRPASKRTSEAYSDTIQKRAGDLRGGYDTPHGMPERLAENAGTLALEAALPGSLPVRVGSVVSGAFSGEGADQLGLPPWAKDLAMGGGSAIPDLLKAGKNVLTGSNKLRASSGIMDKVKASGEVDVPQGLAPVDMHEDAQTMMKQAISAADDPMKARRAFTDGPGKQPVTDLENLLAQTTAGQPTLKAAEDLTNNAFRPLKAGNVVLDDVGAKTITDTRDYMKALEDATGELPNATAGDFLLDTGRKPIPGEVFERARIDVGKKVSTPASQDFAALGGADWTDAVALSNKSQQAKHAVSKSGQIMKPGQERSKLVAVIEEALGPNHGRAKAEELATKVTDELGPKNASRQTALRAKRATPNSLGGEAGSGIAAYLAGAKTTAAYKLLNVLRKLGGAKSQDAVIRAALLNPKHKLWKDAKVAYDNPLTKRLAARMGLAAAAQKGEDQ